VICGTLVLRILSVSLALALDLVLPGNQPEVLLVGRKARLQRVGPAEALKRGWDLGVVQGGMIAATGADELERVRVAAFYPAVHDADRLAPEASCPAMAGLASMRECHSAVGANAQPSGTRIARAARCRHGSTGHDVWVSGTAHSVHPGPVVRATAGVWSSAIVGVPQYPLSLAPQKLS
jgi:hypothetical protein